MRFSKRLQPLTAGTSLADAIVASWVSQAGAIGGSFNSTEIAAAKAFVAYTQANVPALWSSPTRINLHCGDSLAAFRTPLKVGSGATYDTLTNFVAGDVNRATGITGNGSSKHIRTGLLSTSVYGVTNGTHLGVYTRIPTTIPGGDLGGIGCYSGSSNSKVGANMPYSDGNVYADLYGVGTGTGRNSGASGGKGFIDVVLSTAASNSIWKNGALVSAATQNETGNTDPALEMFAMAINSFGTADNFAIGPWAGYEIGTAIPDAQRPALYTAWQNFNAALSRNV